MLGYEGLYEVSNCGNVRSLDRLVPHFQGGFRKVTGRVLKRVTHRSGYVMVTLHKDGVQKTPQVHKLVAEAFLGPCPDGEQARHKNGVRSEPAAWNLEYGTPVQNADDKRRHGTHPAGSANGHSTLTDADVRLIKLRLSEPDATIAADFGVQKAAINKIRHGRTWKHVA